MRILVVDDTYSNRMLLEAMLRAGGYTDVLLAGTAMEALSVLGMEERPEEPVVPKAERTADDRPACGTCSPDGAPGVEPCDESGPTKPFAATPPDGTHSDSPEAEPLSPLCNGVDLVLMDIMMPEINGIQATRTIKAHTEGQHIPVIICTAYPDEQSLNAAFEAGAMDFISWPVTRVELLARVRSALRLKREIDTRRQREADLVRLARELASTNERLTVANLMLHRLSAIDPLTGIPNRRGFENAYEKCWAMAVRKRRSLAVLMVDIDHFKKYNDCCGHQQGDDCLRRISGIIASSLHRPQDSVARYGGEEFVVVLPETDTLGAMHVADRIRESLERNDLSHPDLEESVTVSIGLAAFVPSLSDDPSRLIEMADMAMYDAKRAGRNRCCQYTDVKPVD
jgi:diguanylate cyclase (GGDEF)-like protein